MGPWTRWTTVRYMGFSTTEKNVRCLMQCVFSCCHLSMSAAPKYEHRIRSFDVVTCWTVEVTKEVFSPGSICNHKWRQGSKRLPATLQISSIQPMACDHLQKASWVKPQLSPSPYISRCAAWRCLLHLASGKPEINQQTNVLRHLFPHRGSVTEEEDGGRLCSGWCISTLCAQNIPKPDSTAVFLLFSSSTNNLISTYVRHGIMELHLHAATPSGFPEFLWPCVSISLLSIQSYELQGDTSYSKQI
ncbi:hypothetical protein CEXT_300451 [Caerostris extrusa]|uniref:Uncharacterized protein n=1 Tax=Caerostris extrusa TaxID=172846 RepID=A0AAV4PEY3_CAEEX|nr:hypothetical protein CEXT_300451 [Caerostris extrusa]